MDILAAQAQLETQAQPNAQSHPEAPLEQTQAEGHVVDLTIGDFDTGNTKDANAGHIPADSTLATDALGLNEGV